MANQLFVCFNQSIKALLSVACVEGLISDHIVTLFPDDLTLGSLDDMLPSARRRALEKMEIYVEDDFERQCEVFYSLASGFQEICIWLSGYPFEFLGVCYLGSILPSEVSVECVCVGVEELSEAVHDMNDMHGLAKRASRVDLPALKLIWDRLVAEGSSVRIIRNGIPQSCEEDAFDDTIRDVLHSYGKDNLLQVGLAASDRCSRSAGGLLNPDFYVYRARSLSL